LTPLACGFIALAAIIAKDVATVFLFALIAVMLGAWIKLVLGNFALYAEERSLRSNIIARIAHLEGVLDRHNVKS